MLSHARDERSRGWPEGVMAQNRSRHAWRRLCCSLQPPQNITPLNSYCVEVREVGTVGVDLGVDFVVGGLISLRRGRCSNRDSSPITANQSGQNLNFLPGLVKMSPNWPMMSDSYIKTTRILSRTRLEACG